MRLCLTSGDGSVHASLDDRWLQAKTDQLLLTVGWHGQILFCILSNKWTRLDWNIHKMVIFVWEICVWDRRRKIQRADSCVCLSRKHFVWLVTQQLCKLNTTRFVPPLALYYAIIPFSNEQEWKQWSPLCFSALSNALFYLSSLFSLLPSFVLVDLSSLTLSPVYRRSHLLKLLICLTRNPGILYWL